MVKVGDKVRLTGSNGSLRGKVVYVGRAPMQVGAEEQDFAIVNIYYGFWHPENLAFIRHIVCDVSNLTLDE